MSLKHLTCPSKTLAASINSSSTSFRLNNIKGWDGVDLTSADFGSQAFAVIRNANNTILELIEFDPTTIASASITIVRRGLKFTGDLTTEVTANKLSWTSGDSQVDIGVDTPQMYQWLQEYVDTAVVAGGVPATTTVLGLAKASVVPASAASPIFVGDNDPRVPNASGAVFVSATTGMIVMFGSATPPTGFLLCNGQAVSRTTYSALFTVLSTSYGVGDGSTTFNVPDLRSSFPVGYGQKTKAFTFLDAAVNTGTDVITVTSNKFLYTGQAVALTTSGILPTGLSATTYYVIYVSDTTIKLATSRANADDGTAVDITAAAGGGTHTLTLTLTSRAMGEEGGEESHTIQTEELASHLHGQSVNNGTATGSTGTEDSTGFNTNYSSVFTQASGGDTPHNTMPPFVTVNYIIKY